MNRSALLFTILFLTAGCLSSSGPETPPLPERGPYVDPIVEEHDHSDPAEHALSTPNVELLHHLSLNPDSETEAVGLYGELDVVGDLAVAAVTGMAGETPGFVTLDVSDRGAPRLLAFTESPDTGRLADVKIHPSGTWLLAAAQSGTQPRAPSPETLQNAEYWSSQNGLRLYRIADPAKPELVQTLPSRTGYGCHMVYWKPIDGADWLFCVGRAIEVYRFDADQGSLEIAAVYAPQSERGLENVLGNDRDNPQAFATEARLSVTPHDMTVQDDPVTGDPLMIVSWWDLGLRIVDVSDPTQPRELGAWAGEGADTFEGNLHTGMVSMLGDRRVLTAVPELLSDKPPAFWVVDVTDYASPQILGEWVAPGGHGADGIRFSLHNFQVVEDRAYVAYYHAGVWVLDLDAIAAGKAAEDAVLGYYLPHAETKPVTPPEATSVPDVWDVVVTRGYVYALDIPTGLYVLHYLPDELGDPQLTGFS